MGFGGRGPSGRGGRGRGGVGRGRGGGVRHNVDQGPPSEVIELGYFTHPCENDIVCNTTCGKIPYFNAPVFFENKEIIGKIDEIFGGPKDNGFSVKLNDGLKASSFKSQQKIFIDPSKLLPIERFTAAGQHQRGGTQRGRGMQRGGSRGSGRGGTGNRGRGGNRGLDRGGFRGGFRGGTNNNGREGNRGGFHNASGGFRGGRGGGRAHQSGSSGNKRQFNSSDDGGHIQKRKKFDD